ncbi:MAG: AI-2E family transporter [Clostridia bacterium]|nr:AI-2E family transporter [Clostridia bacterium]
MKPNKNERFSYVRAGIMSFCVISAVIVFFFAIFKLDDILAFIGKVANILQPVILGAVIAFLMNPMTKTLEVNINKVLNKIFKKKGEFKKLSLYSAITLSLLFFVFVISIFFYMVIPEFATTLTGLIAVLPDQIRNLSAWVISIMENNDTVANVINSGLSALNTWVQENLVANATTYATYLASGVINVVNFIVDCLIGIVLAFYILAGKKTIKRQIRKILLAFTTEQTTEKVIGVMRKSNIIFSGFINGKLINALIIGILCFIGCSIMNIPYIMLVSVVIAVTDMIPVFGPYIGAVPCALLILLNSPIKCLYFVIFIILLQVFDGNVIGPRILGESTGLSAFWVMVAIILGGGLFGIIGMLIGVPTFAVIYYLVRAFIHSLLRKKNYNIDAAKIEIKETAEEAVLEENNEQEPVNKAK